MKSNNDQFMGGRLDDSITSPQFCGEYFLLPQEVIQELEQNAPAACFCHGNLICFACEERELQALYGPAVQAIAE